MLTQSNIYCIFALVLEIMDTLLIKSQKKNQTVIIEFTRNLTDKILLNNKITFIKGTRRVGKTTLLLQYVRLKLPIEEKKVYISLDDIYFLSNNLYELVEKFEKENDKFLLLDEVYKYPSWSGELKLMYNDFPGLKIVTTSSSSLKIYQSETNLNRRAVTYILNELSLREFIYFETKQIFPVLSLEKILSEHEHLALKIMTNIILVFEFKKFPQYSSYPFFIDDMDFYHDKLMQILNLVLETDRPTIEKMDFEYIAKLKKLLFAVASSTPFTPNISKLSKKTEISRNSLTKVLFYLYKVLLVKLLNKTNKGNSSSIKPDKKFINNPHLQFAMDKNNTNTRVVRENIFVNQLNGLHKIHGDKKGYFLVNEKSIFEIAEKNISKYQINNIPNNYIVKDDYEYGVNNIIPLWFFGFLY